MRAFRIGWEGTPRFLVLVVGGVAIAGASTLLLAKAEPLSIALILTALLLCIPPFVVSDARVFWLGLLLLALPLNVSKRLLAEERVVWIVENLGMPWGNFTLAIELADFALFALLGLWLLRRLTTREPLYWPRMSYLPVAFLGWSTLGAFFSPYGFLTAMGLVRQLKFALVYFWVSNNVSSRKFGRIIIATLLAGLVLEAGVTIGRYASQNVDELFGGAFGRTQWGPGENRTEWVAEGDVTESRGLGTFGHPSPTAMYFGLMLPLALSVSWMGTSRTTRLVAAGAFVVGLVGAYLTFSRGGMLGIIVSSIVCGAMLVRRGVISRRVVALAVVLAIAVTPLVALKVQRFFVTRQEYVEGHLVHWQVGAGMAAINPLIGTGLNTNTAVRYKSNTNWQEHIGDFLPIHNHYLVILIEVGVLGALLYFGFFALAGLEAWRLSRSSDPSRAMLAVAVLGSYVAVAINVTVDMIHLDALQTLVWFFAGLAAALKREEREAAAVTSPPAVSRRSASRRKDLAR